MIIGLFLILLGALVPMSTALSIAAIMIGALKMIFNTALWVSYFITRG